MVFRVTLWRMCSPMLWHNNGPPVCPPLTVGEVPDEWPDSTNTYFAFRLEVPVYKAIKPKDGKVLKMIIKPEVSIISNIACLSCCSLQTALVRPFGLAAVLRNIKFNQVSKAASC